MKVIFKEYPVTTFNESIFVISGKINLENKRYIFAPQCFNSKDSFFNSIKVLRLICEKNNLNGIFVINKNCEELELKNQDEVTGILLKNDALSVLTLSNDIIYLPKNWLVTISNLFINEKEGCETIVKFGAGDFAMIVYYLCLWKNFKIGEFSEPRRSA